MDLPRIYLRRRGLLYVCPNCGSSDIQWGEWVHANTGARMGDEAGSYSWCNACSRDGRDGEFKYAYAAPGEILEPAIVILINAPGNEGFAYTASAPHDARWVVIRDLSIDDPADQDDWRRIGG